MNPKPPPKTPKLRFSLDPSTPTMADVIARLTADESLTPMRRRDLLSAIRRLCELVNRDPKTFVADVQTVRAALTMVHPVQSGISAKTLQNIRSNVLAALRHTLGAGWKTERRQQLCPAWRALRTALPSKRLRAGLSRFIRFCSGSGIAPEQVSDEIVVAFMDAIRTETFTTNPNDLHRRTCRLWNEAVPTIPGWPNVILSVPNYRRPRWTTPLADFPKSFRDEVEGHLRWLSGVDIFVDHPPPKNCKPRTIEQRRKHIEIAASALVARGCAVKDVTSLRCLIEIDAFKEMLRHYLERLNHEPTQYLRDLAKSLILVARHWVRVDHEHLETLREIKRRLGGDRTGLTEKNRNALRQLESPDNVRRLVCLPVTLLAEVERRSPTDAKAAIKAQIAVALEILLMAPMRAHNLVGLRLDRHIVRPAGPKGPVHLVLPESETKAGEAVEYALSPQSTALLDTYFRQYRPLLCPEGDPWLFPRTGGGCKAQSTLCQQIVEAVRRRTGLRLTVHQFRHAAAKVLLDREPGNFETLKHLLGHRNLKSTLDFYAEVQTTNAGRHYDDIILGIRGRATPETGSSLR